MPSQYRKKEVTTARTAAKNAYLFTEVTVEEAIPEREFVSWQVPAVELFTTLPESGVLTIKSPRQHGKSYFLQSAAVWCAVNHAETTTIVLSPVNSQNGRMYEDIKYMLYEDERVDKFLGLPEMQVVFKNGSKIIFKSAETKDRLRGFTADWLFIDEAAYIADDIYPIVYPYLTKTRGRLIITSTPRFKAGVFYTNYMKGVEDGEVFRSIDVTAYDESFFISDEQKAQFKDMMPPSAYKTEIEGLFLENNEGLFGDFSGCIRAVVTDDAPVWAGIDWAAKGTDRTVLVALNKAGEVCEILSWNKTEAVTLIDHIAEWVNEHSGTIRKVIVEDNSIGDIYFDLLKRSVKRPSAISAFVTTNTSKRQLVDNLAALFARQGVLIPNDKTLTTQLSLFTASLTDTGKLAYAGANGSHDDYVMALAFAAWNINLRKAQYCVEII